MRAIAADLGDGRTTAGSTAEPAAEKWCERTSRQQTAQTAVSVHLWQKFEWKSLIYVRGFCRSCRLPRRRRESAGFGVWFCRLCCRGDAVGFLTWNSADARRASSLPPILAPPLSERVTRVADRREVGRSEKLGGGETSNARGTACAFSRVFVWREFDEPDRSNRM